MLELLTMEIVTALQLLHVIKVWSDYSGINAHLGEGAPLPLHRDGSSLDRGLDALRHFDQLKGVDFLHDFCNRRLKIENRLNKER